VSVFRFPSNTKQYKKWEVSIYQIIIYQNKNDLIISIAILNKNLVNRSMSFENELVPLNSHIGGHCNQASISNHFQDIFGRNTCKRTNKYTNQQKRWIAIPSSGGIN